MKKNMSNLHNKIYLVLLVLLSLIIFIFGLQINRLKKELANKPKYISSSITNTVFVTNTVFITNLPPKIYKSIEIPKGSYKLFH